MLTDLMLFNGFCWILTERIVADVCWIMTDVLMGLEF